MLPTELWPQLLANPADPELSARFLEALRQSGDPRAEIFHQAAELEKFPSYYAQHDAIKKQYLSALAPWQRELDAAASPWPGKVTFFKGWPVELTITAQDFRDHAADIVRTLPLRHLNLTAVADCPGVFDTPQLNQIASIGAAGQKLSDQPVRRLAASWSLQSLRWLDLSGSDLTEADVEILAAAPRLRQVEHLCLAKNPCRDPVDAAGGCGYDGETGRIVLESIYLPKFGLELESRHGPILWLHALDRFLEKHPPSRYSF